MRIVGQTVRLWKRRARICSIWPLCDGLSAGEGVAACWRVGAAIRSPSHVGEVRPAMTRGASRLVPEQTSAAACRGFIEASLRSLRNGKAQLVLEQRPQLRRDKIAIGSDGLFSGMMSRPSKAWCRGSYLPGPKC
jgi:hypothetical protein